MLRNLICALLCFVATTTGPVLAANTTTTTTTANSEAYYDDDHHDEQETSPVVVNLSQPWKEGPLYNRNRAYCKIQSVMLPALAEGYVVIQDGLLVAEGYVNDNTAATLNPAWSVTKSFSTMIIGKLVELNLVTVTESLGAIFNLDSEWEGVTQATEKKAVLLEELLTMTSGLIQLAGDGDSLTGQDTLLEVLNLVEYKIEEKGNFNYLGSWNILSRIIVKRSGLKPLEFVTANNLFSKLGINETDFEWLTFGDVQGTAFGLETNPRTLAKLGQLYLQKGLAAEGDQLIQETWIDWSTTDQLSDDTTSIGPLIPGYGYQWYADRDDRDGALLVPIPALEGAFSAVGIGGQQIIVIPRTNTVIAIMCSDPVGVYAIAFSIVIMENLEHLDTAVENDAKCGDFSLISTLYEIPSAVGKGLLKILSNMILE